MIILLLSVFLQSLEVIFCQRFFFNWHVWNTGGGFGCELIEEVKKGACIDLTRHHVYITILHHFYVRNCALIKSCICLEQLVKKLIPRLKRINDALERRMTGVFPSMIIMKACFIELFLYESSILPALALSML